MKNSTWLLSLLLFICTFNSIKLFSQAVGVGTSTPQAYFNVAQNRTVLFGLDTTSIGNKFIWYPTKGALRFGEIDVLFDPNAWHYANVGVNSFAFGANTRATAPQSIASGVSSTASGFYAWAHGFAAYAYGDHSMAVGQNVGAEGGGSFAFGNGNRAVAFGSQAIGNDNYATGTFSTAMGNNTQAKCYGCFVIGRNNDSVPTSSNTTWVTTDPLFIIGNGEATPSNAMVVLKNSVTGIGLNPTGGLISHGMLQIKTLGSRHNLTLYNSNETNRWGFHVVSDLNLYFDGVFKGAFNDVDGVYTAVSDRRYKKDIEAISPVLGKILKLTMYKYHFIDNKPTDPFSLGFMAQDVEQLFPGLASYMNDKEGHEVMGLNYDKFTVLAIKAIQEQQEIITTQQKKIDDLANRILAIEKKVK